MKRTLVLFLVFEAATFFFAAAVHRGFLIGGYEHGRASIAETVIGTVLLLAAFLVMIRPSVTRRVGIVAQAFALLGTLVGITMVVIGVGPRTVPDVIYHMTIIVVLAVGLIRAARATD